MSSAWAADVGRDSDATFVTTSGVIAMLNLEAQIEGRRALATVAEPCVADRTRLFELMALRGLVLGRVADHEHVALLAEELVKDAPEAGAAFLARARANAVFHLFAAAVCDVDDAAERGVDPLVVNDERASILQAVGRCTEALEMRLDAVERKATFASLGALAGAYAALGDRDAAERRFHESRQHYRGASPFPLALLDFQRGHMWLAEGDLERARRWFRAAYERLPGYAMAQGHLAEVEAALGDVEPAIARLQALAHSSDDPDYAAQLARLLRARGRTEEASVWWRHAARRYDELVRDHLEAFADHAAEFWMEADPHRALVFAEKNLAVRRTTRALALVERASRAC